MNASLRWRNGPNTIEINRSEFAALGGMVLTDMPGGRDQLRELVHPSLRDIVDELSPADPAAHSFMASGATVAREYVDAPVLAVRIRHSSGQLAGTAVIAKPAAGMATLAALTAAGDQRHFERAQHVAKPASRPAAILFADLQASSPLARRLSPASYFALGRRLVRATDQCVIGAGGLVGRDAGDGVVAFFLAETAGSESAAARNCISAARALRAAVDGVADRTDLQPGEVVLRFGLHWGFTLYIGNITTGARSEVTALGNEVNQAARIEACATGGLVLASKDLIDRLGPDDADALDLHPNQLTYTALTDLAIATDKARRDAPATTVCEV